MKYFIAIALIATVASAAIKPAVVSGEMAEIQQIIAAINSPSTNPATAAALQDMLFDVLGVNPEPISVGPAIVDFPLPEAAVAAPVVPSPVVVGPIPEGAPTPLVQIILNINQAAGTGPVAVAPVVVPEIVRPEPVHVVEFAPEPVHVVEFAPEPVHVVESAPVPVQVVESAPAPVQVVESAPAPVQVVESAPAPVQVVESAPAPVQVVETAPVAAEPVLIGTPIIPAPAVSLPETLN